MPLLAAQRRRKSWSAEAVAVATVAVVAIIVVVVMVVVVVGVVGVVVVVVGLAGWMNREQAVSLTGLGP